MPNQVEIIVVSSVEDFRGLAGSEVGEEHLVLEIGCSTGKTTRRLAKRCARVVAVDVSSEAVDQTREELAGFDNVEVVRGDARDIVALKRLMPEPDVIFLDIGGRALLDNVATLLRQCLRAFRPRLIVVRSHELAEVASLITEARPPAQPRLRQLNASAREEVLRRVSGAVAQQQRQQPPPGRAEARQEQFRFGAAASFRDGRRSQYPGAARRQRRAEEA